MAMGTASQKHWIRALLLREENPTMVTGTLICSPFLKETFFIPPIVEPFPPPQAW